MSGWREWKEFTDTCLYQGWDQRLHLYLEGARVASAVVEANWELPRVADLTAEEEALARLGDHEGALELGRQRLGLERLPGGWPSCWRGRSWRSRR